APESLHAVRNYTVAVLVAIGLVAGYGIWAAYAHPRDGAGACRDSLERLDTRAGQPGGSIDDLRAFVQTHINVCREVLERLDER
ncbi:MAG: hypothetical protein MJA83_09130, partial [Gammaproteobacteria bacterium]|nr:hypothetical protein [Gammaproteobacteria bacterium]